LVVVGKPHPIIAAILRVFRSTLHMKVNMVVSSEEAMAFLHEQDETLGKRDG
jgi:hypothetical protein